MTGPKPIPVFSRQDATVLLRLATHAIASRLDLTTSTNGMIEEVPLDDDTATSPLLRGERATFVTLYFQGKLRGCCGSLKAFEPLRDNIARSAVTAAFGDRRFSPVTADEFPGLELHLSILNPAEPIAMLTESDLVSQLRPQRDGVILTESELGRQGVFLPAVWEQLPTAGDFVRRLKLKAGLPADFWSPWIRAARFTVESIHGRTADWLGSSRPGSESPWP